MLLDGFVVGPMLLDGFVVGLVLLDGLVVGHVLLDGLVVVGLVLLHGLVVVVLASSPTVGSTGASSCAWLLSSGLEQLGFSSKRKRQ